MVLVGLLLTAAAVLRSQATEKRLAVYSPQANYSVAVQDYEGTEYVGLIDLLEPLGKITAKGDKNWKVEFTPNGSSRSFDLEFSNGKRRSKARGNSFDLPGNFVLSGGRGFVPLAALPNLLSRVLEMTIQLHESGKRLFVGSVAMKMTVEMRKNPSRLVLTFPSPVGPFLASEGNNTRMVFSREPVVSSGSDVMNFSDSLIGTATFAEKNGTAELVVHGSAPLLATFSDNGRTITISAAPQQAAAPPPPPPAPTPAPTSNPPQPAAQFPSPHAPRFLVVIDPGHGGEERGAALTETLAEKDVTLAFARRLHRELESKGIAAMLLRNSDAVITMDQRAVAANSARPAVYIAIHASTLGSGVRIYTSLLPPTPPTNRRSFLPWDSAQSAYLDSSSMLAGSIAAECNDRKLPVRAIAASMRPLNSITSAAVAVELAPPPESNADEFTSEKYQQTIAAAIGTGIAALRPKLEASR